MTTSQTIDIHGPLKGEIEVPGDKSMTHRAIMLSSLAKGKSIIEQPLLGEDCLRTIEIFKLLGVEIEIENIVLLLILQDINISIYHIKRYILEILVQQRAYLLVF